MALLGVAGVAASFGPIVRARVDEVAARAGARVSITSVRPRWNGVVLDGVAVTLEDAPSFTIVLDVIEVDGLFGGRTATARGGSVEVVGSPAMVAAELGALRERLATPQREHEPGGGPRSRVSAEGLRARWSPRAGADDGVVAEGIRVTPGEGGGLDVAIDTLRASLGGSRASARGLATELRRDGGSMRLAALSAREASVDVAAGGPAAPAAGDPGPSGVVPAAAASGSVAPRWREHVAALAAELDARLLADTRVVVDALSAKVGTGADVVSVGPGRFELRREPGPPRRLVVEVAQGVQEGEARTLAVRIAAPFGDGAEKAPLVLEVHGGPIPVSALGIREGELGLVEPERAWLEADATVEVDDVAQLVRFDGEGRVRGLSIRHAALSDQPIRGIDLGFRGQVQAALDGTHLRAKQGELQLGALRVVGDGEVMRRAGAAGRPDEWTVDARWEVPLVPCQSLLDTAPTGLLPLVSGSTMAGSLALKGSAKLDTAQLDRTYAVQWDAGVGCRMVAPRPQIAVERFLKPFKKVIYTPEGTTREAEFGPGTPDWTPGSRITHLMTTAVITAEDGRFERHGGFDHEAIRNSIRENVRARRFVRGASTISMQLAKNLYLPRDKTLSRKLEEAVLTLYLEQVLTKEQLMELYLNVVEFGPMVYGVGPAAQHYFRTGPASLSVSQCFYLASILPSPKVQHFGAGGAVSTGWMNHLRRLMKYAHHRGRLNDADLDEGLSEVPVFGSSTPIREPAEGEGDAAEALRREPWTDGEGDG